MVVFDAALGKFPSDQGWVLYSEDAAPLDGLNESNLRIRGGALIQGPTGGVEQDNGNYQWHEIADLDFGFDTDRLEITLRLRILESTRAGGTIPLAGFGVRIADRSGRRVSLFLAEAAAYLVGARPNHVQQVSADTRSRTREYHIRIDRKGAEVEIDDIPTLRLSRSDFETSLERNAVVIGDITRTARGTFSIERMIFRQTPNESLHITP